MLVWTYCYICTNKSAAATLANSAVHFDFVQWVLYFLSLLHFQFNALFFIISHTPCMQAFTLTLHPQLTNCPNCRFTDWHSCDYEWMDIHTWTYICISSILLLLLTHFMFEIFCMYVLFEKGVVNKIILIITPLVTCIKWPLKMFLEFIFVARFDVFIQNWLVPI